MKQHLFAWLAGQLLPTLEPLLRAEAARIVAGLQEQIRAEAAQARPAKRFIGQ